MSNVATSRILLVDDDRFSRLMIRSLLERDGHQVLEASEGAEGIALYRSKRPDLVLLDAQMPGVDGFECCGQMRRSTDNQTVPILMVTGLEAEESVERAFQAGATDYVTKPIKPAVLRGRIQHLLKAARAEQKLRHSETQYRSLVHNLREVIFQLDSDGNLTFVNPSWQRLMGFSESESLGIALSEFLHPQEQNRFWVQFNKVQGGSGRYHQHRGRCITKDRRALWVEIQLSTDLTREGSKVVTGRLNNVNDSTLREQYRRLEYCVMRALAKQPQSTPAIRRTLQAICGNLNFQLGEFWQFDTASGKLWCAETWHANTPAIAKFVQDSQPLTFSPGEGLPGLIWETQMPMGILNVTQNPQFVRGALAQSAGFKTGIACPATYQDEKSGVILLLSQAEHRLEEDLLRVTLLLARQLSQYCLTKQVEFELRQCNQILQLEIQRAAKYVVSLLPKPVTIFGPEASELEASEGDQATGALSQYPIQICTKFQPSSQLGGDAFDYYWLDEDNLAFYLLDVAGHGVKAALLSVSVLNILRKQALSKADFHRPETVLAELNSMFQMNDNGEDYFTLWYGVYHAPSRQLTFATAGHPPGVMVSPQADDFRVEHLQSNGIAIGMLPDMPFDTGKCHVIPGSSLFIFSDGAYEVPTHDGIWGIDGWSAFLRSYRQSNRDDIDALLAEALRISNQSILDDDFSVMEIKFHQA